MQNALQLPHSYYQLIIRPPSFILPVDNLSISQHFHLLTHLFSRAPSIYSFDPRLDARWIHFIAPAIQHTLPHSYSNCWCHSSLHVPSKVQLLRSKPFIGRTCVTTPQGLHRHPSCDFSSPYRSICTRLVCVVFTLDWQSISTCQSSNEVVIPIPQCTSSIAILSCWVPSLRIRPYSSDSPHMSHMLLWVPFTIDAPCQLNDCRYIDKFFLCHVTIVRETDLSRMVSALSCLQKVSRHEVKTITFL